MSTAHVLLGLLIGGPKHGYELKHHHDARLPAARPLAFGQVYATLGRLERDGLIETAGTDRDGGPERVSYAITERGRRSLDEWLESVEPPAPYVQSTLFSRLMVALVAVGHDAARGYLVRQRAAHTARLREWTAIKADAGAAMGEVVAADYAIAHLDADLRWLRTTLDRLSTAAPAPAPAPAAPTAGPAAPGAMAAAVPPAGDPGHPADPVASTATSHSPEADR